MADETKPDPPPRNAPVPVPLITNRAAGRALVRRLRTRLRSPEGQALTRLMEPGLAEMAEVVAGAAREGPGVVAVSGGDGTLHAAAQVLAGSGVALLPVPTGTLNYFARRHGVRTVRDALDALESGRDRLATLGVVDDRLFLNTLVIGAYAGVVGVRDRLRRFLPRWPAALLAFALVLVRSPRVRVRLDTSEGSRERHTSMVWIGLGRGSYPRSLEGAVGYVDEEQTLEIVILGTSSRRATFAFLLRFAFRTAMGREAADDPALEVLHAPYLLIDSDRPLRATVDGEPARFRSPLFVSVMPGALKVRGP